MAFVVFSMRESPLSQKDKTDSIFDLGLTLVNIQDELNLLTQQENPPALSLSITSNQTIQVEADTLKGQQLLLEQTPSIDSPAWSSVATSAVESLLWSITTLTDSNPPATSRFYRVTNAP